MKYSIFCDESGTVKERYMVLGGIIIPHKNVRHVEAKIKSIKEKKLFGEHHEIKFTKLNNDKKLQLYKHIVEEVYLDKEYGIDFRCVIFDTQQITHKKYDSSMKDGIPSTVRGFYKQYYQLLYHQFCKVNTEGVFDITLDARSDPRLMYSELFQYLSSKIGESKIKYIRPMDSKQSNLLQLVDLLLGSVSCEVNNRSKSQKLELINFIKDKKQLKGLSASSYRNSFRVWNFDYTKSNKNESTRWSIEEAFPEE